MDKTKNGIRAHLDKWEKLRSERQVAWKDNWLENSWCADCRLCCGPQGDDEPFPMALLPGQMTGNYKDNFYLKNADTALLGSKGCKALHPAGCSLPKEKRPPACGMFPIVLANGRLYLYKNCPASLFTPLCEFYQLAEQVAEMLDTYELKDLRHISLMLPVATLSEKYIDLSIQIFDEQGKNVKYL